MDVEIFHTIYDYHYRRFRKIWDSIMSLSEAQFVQNIPYSIGSLRNHMVHVIDDDLGWISLLEGQDRPQQLHPEDFLTRADVRAKYDTVETYVLNFIHAIDETMLHQEFVWNAPMTSTPQRVIGWQVLLHVVNHGTDHRAQVLRVLHDLGAPTFDQDLMGHLVETGKTSI